MEIGTEGKVAVGPQSDNPLAALESTLAGTAAEVVFGEVSVAGTSQLREEQRSAEPKLETTMRVVQPGDWEKYRADFVRIEHDAFANTPAGGFSESGLRAGLTRQDGVAVIAIDNTTGRIIGYSYTFPDSRNSTNRRGDTHYVDNTAFDPAYQGKGLVQPLQQVLEAELLKRGVEYLTRDSADYHPDAKGRTYADKVRAANAQRIIEEFGHDSPWGHQVWFKMRIAPGAS